MRVGRQRLGQRGVELLLRHGASSGSCANVGATNAANGACDSQEATGLGLASNDGLDILKNFTSTTLSSGVANNIFQSAMSNNCGQCLH